MKHFAARRLIGLFVVALLLLSAGACKKKKKVVTPPTDVIPQQEAVINRAGQFAASNQYDKAIFTCSDFFQRFPQSPVLDHALFVCGIIHAADPTQDSDYSESLAMLQRIPQEMPTSNYAPTAQMVVHLLQNLNQLQESIAEGTKNLRSLQTADAQQKETINELQALQTQHLKMIRDLQNEIQKIKRIDLNKHP